MVLLNCWIRGGGGFGEKGGKGGSGGGCGCVYVGVL